MKKYTKKGYIIKKKNVMILCGESPVKGYDWFYDMDDKISLLYGIKRKDNGMTVTGLKYSVISGLGLSLSWVWNKREMYESFN